MPDSFALLQPVWLGAALIALMTLLSRRGVSAQDVHSGQTAGTGPLLPLDIARGMQIRGAARVALMAGAAAIVSAWLMFEGTSAASLLLSVLTLGAAGWFHTRALRVRTPPLHPGWLTVVVVLRVAEGVERLQTDVLQLGLGLFPQREVGRPELLDQFGNPRRLVLRRAGRGLAHSSTTAEKISMQSVTKTTS